MQRFGGRRPFGGQGGGGFRRDSGPREMHKAVCADCKADCEVPFKPTEGKPVYCKECYAKHRKF
jgi:CxxC-x17-CxxC domain-containing protein